MSRTLPRVNVLSLFSLLSVISIAACSEPKIESSSTTDTNAANPAASDVGTSSATPTTETTTGTNPPPTENTSLALTRAGIFELSNGDNTTNDVPFGSAVTSAQSLISSYLGEPRKTTLHEECEGGSITITTWENGFNISEVEGEFVGWSVQPDTPSADMKTLDGVGIGASRSGLGEDIQVDENSTLGIEFYTENLTGTLSSTAPDAVVTSLRVGRGCVIR